MRKGAERFMAKICEGGTGKKERDRERREVVRLDKWNECDFDRF